MAKVDVYNHEAKVVKSMDIADEVFGIEPNEQAIYDAVLAYQAGLRQGTHSTLTRSFVSGTGKKPYRQKGTGRARQGSTRATQWRGGGIAFGPHPRKYNLKTNRKVRRLALRSALSEKNQESNLTLIENLNFDEIKTKTFAQVLKNIKANKALVVLNEKDDNVILSARNIPDAKTALTSTINVYDVMNAGTVVLTKAAVEKIEEVYA